MILKIDNFIYYLKISLLKVYKQMLIEIKKSLNRILNIPRPAKKFVAISLDSLACVISIWASYYLRLGDLVYLSEKGLESLILALVISFPIFNIFGLYKARLFDFLFNIHKFYWD